jgi:hypothetical protein
MDSYSTFKTATSGRWRLIARAGWFVALAAYTAVGAANIWPTLSVPTLRPAEAFVSTDSYLEAATGVPHASARILHILAPLARDKTVVLVLPDNGVRSAFINQNVSYLSWPREVRWLCADSPNVQQELFAMPPTNVAAIIFWDTPPFPNMPAGVHIGANQVVVPVTLAKSSHQ